MVKYEDLQYLESEKQQELRKEPPSPQPLLQRLCPGPRLLLLSLGLSLLLLVVLCVTGSQNAKLQRDLLALRTSFDNFTSSSDARAQELSSRGASLQEKVTALQAKVEQQQQELEAAHTLDIKLNTLGKKLEAQGQETRADQSTMLQRVQQLVKDVSSLTCELTVLKSNGSRTTCCLSGWVEHEGSCYWFSRAMKPWSEADRYCQLQNAHLVVINSADEQDFIKEHLGTALAWMGLTDQDGAWKWADGTDYETSYQNWGPGQPDDWKDHGKGGGEDCAHFFSNGEWNDGVCGDSYHWICEAKLGRAS
ncbi:asialoglycoprotein receptor 1-like [Dasypus novemcinctus]|uniref:asialoglycoprotein receptor 1-like n=1 Tax=Dasypus novemcinctus TaxID=9361 RepID=UPI000328A686|nr:asialoglycoprotein receptor 1-like [Dasypus novemcinctus]XP_058139206.1 asialoglycoprotein receptor 1-like [Dasypus novemcinctus]XP_058139208.1 asialoglycoprotein receptor 1-like [Dasypus novemcinctus]